MRSCSRFDYLPAEPVRAALGFPGRLALVIVLLVGVGLVEPALANDAPPPPTPSALIGERLEFSVRWGILRVASAVLEVEGGEDGRITFRATARTRSIVEALYPVRDLVESTVWLPDMRVDHYLKKGKTGRKEERRVDIHFDVENGLAQYTRDGEARDPIEVPPGVQDPLSGLYAFRTLEVDDEKKIELDVTDGKKVTRGRLTVVGREQIRTPAGVFNTVVIEPSLEGIGGVFETSPNAKATIWVTEDEWRRPVKLKGKVSVGSFTAVLVDVSHPSQEGQEATAKRKDSGKTHPQVNLAPSH
jgi:hypothetical protein